MNKIKNLADLRNLKEKLQSGTKLREKSEYPELLVQVKVAMATCCIASGSRETMNYIVDELDKRNIEAVITQTGCMGYCYAYPRVMWLQPCEPWLLQIPGKILSTGVKRMVRNLSLIRQKYEQNWVMQISVIVKCLILLLILYVQTQMP